MAEQRAEHMLSTSDNPHNPFTDFDDWNTFDQHAGYYSLAYLGRVVKTSNDISDYDQSLAIEWAIDDIVRENVLGIYIKVSEKQPSGP